MFKLFKKKTSPMVNNFNRVERNRILQEKANLAKQASKERRNNVLSNKIEASRINAKINSITKLSRYPTFCNDEPIQYCYVLPVVPVNNINIIDDILVTEEKIVDVKPNNDVIELIYEELVVGIINDKNKTQMLKDWIEKNRPVNAILLADGKTANLRFYHDQRKSNSWREQTVTKLISYAGRAKQEAIEYLYDGEELDLEEDENDETKINVISGTEIIGRLPSKIAKRYIEEDCALIVVEEIRDDLNDSFETIYIPVVRIYW